MQDETYNGWKNYPTWAVNLWLSNEEALYREAMGRVAAIATDAPNTPNVAEGVWTVEQATRFDVANNFKEWVTDDLAPDLGASFAADLLGYALGEVDWNEIADAWVADAKDSAVA